MINALEYFDLNKRITVIQDKNADAIEQIESTNNSEQVNDKDPLIDDMDEFWSSYGSDHESKLNGEQKFSSKDLLSSFKRKSDLPFPWRQQIFLYSGTIIGTIFSSIVVDLQVGAGELTNISLPFLILSLFLAIIIAPVSFEKLRMVAPKSILPHFILFFQNGVFWYFLVAAFSFG